jgi:DNA-binding NarL/FixJ family response regulator
MLRGIDSHLGPIQVRLSTNRAEVASRLLRLLADAGSMEVLGSPVADPAVFSHHAEPESPAVLVLDCAAFASRERLRLQRTARRHSPARVLWYLDDEPSSDHAAKWLLDAVRVGWCHGFITADCAPDCLLRAITAVARRDYWLPRAILAEALSESHGLSDGLGHAAAPTLERRRTLAQFTVREREILRLIQRGLTNKEVGRQLGIEEDTVKKHLRNMYAKLGVHRRAQMLLRSSYEARMFE